MVQALNSSIHRLHAIVQAVPAPDLISSADPLFSVTISPIKLLMSHHPKVAFATSLRLISMSSDWALNAHPAVEPEL